MEWLGYALMAAVAWFIISQVVIGLKGGSERHCMTCGSDGEPKTRTPGHIFIEIVLWCCYIVPGLIYSIWRHTAKEEVCEQCGSSTLVPVGSPSAQVSTTVVYAKCPDCAESVLPDARKCKHCGSALTPKSIAIAPSEPEPQFTKMPRR